MQFERKDVNEELSSMTMTDYDSDKSHWSEWKEVSKKTMMMMKGMVTEERERMDEDAKILQIHHSKD